MYHTLYDSSYKARNSLYVCSETKMLFLGAFSKLREATISFMSVCASVRLSAWNNSVPTGRILMKLDI